MDRAASVFAALVCDGFMLEELAVQMHVCAMLVRIDGRSLANVLAQDGLEIRASDVGDMKRAHHALALDQREDCHLVAVARLLVAPEFLAPKGFVGFNDLAR